MVPGGKQMDPSHIVVWPGLIAAPGFIPPVVTFVTRCKWAL
jgi:hypothetical protein